MMQFLAGFLAIGLTSLGDLPSADLTSGGSERVTIVAVSGEPPIASGTLATFVRITGRAAGGDRDYLVPFLQAGQSKPEIGATCTIRFSRFGSQGHVGPQLEPVNGGGGVSGYQCDDRATVTIDR